MISTKVLVTAASSFVLYTVGKLVHQLVIKPMFWPLRDLPGPKNHSFIFGNMSEIVKSGPGEVHEEWAREYGNTLTYKAFFNVDRIFTMDLKALSHIFKHSGDYHKPSFARDGIRRLIGDGILVTEGEQHRMQRRIMNPSFSPTQIKALTPIFFQKAQQLRDIWNSFIDDKQNGEPQTIEVLSWLGRLTLDIIGLAGFAYRFDALNVNDEPSELNKALTVLFNAQEGVIQILPLLQGFIPILRRVPTERGKQEALSRNTMNRIGLRLVTERKKAILQSQQGDKYDQEHEVEENNDLLSALIKANMDTEVPDEQRLSDEDVLAQIPTFFVAGHETTSTETSWCLYALSTHPSIQTRLRAELSSIESDTPSMDELMALPYLDAVVRETMRVHAAVPSTIRVAMKDDVIPLSEPYTDKKGNVRRELRVSEGDTIFMHILAINRSKEIWGEDAMEFNPDRWTKLPEAANNIPGVWGNILTFLGGARGCIGYRFALVEMKAILFTLLRAFEFELAVPAEEIYGRSVVVTRPYVKSEKEKGAQLPLRVKRHVRSTQSVAA